MNTWLLIGVVAVLVYTCRLSGFALNIAQSSSFWEQFLHFVPISLFAALVVLSLARENEMLDIKIIALLMGGAAAYRTHRTGLGILAGFLLLWIVGGFQ
jgi:branched-subunit amino acid transport protein